MAIVALLRHAKAVKDPAGGDHARSLSPGGRAAAEVAGRRLRSLLPADVLVIASDARRTRETAAHAFPSHPTSKMRLEPSLYAARPEVLLAYLRGLSSDVSAAVLVGHNPGISELAVSLALDGAPADLHRLAQGMATADAVLIDVPTPWSDLTPRSGRVTALLSREDIEN